MVSGFQDWGRLGVGSEVRYGIFGLVAPPGSGEGGWVWMGPVGSAASIFGGFGYVELEWVGSFGLGLLFGYRWVCVFCCVGGSARDSVG